MIFISRQGGKSISLTLLTEARLEYQEMENNLNVQPQIDKSIQGHTHYAHSKKEYCLSILIDKRRCIWQCGVKTHITK